MMDSGSNQDLVRIKSGSSQDRVRIESRSSQKRVRSESGLQLQIRIKSTATFNQLTIDSEST